MKTAGSTLLRVPFKSSDWRAHQQLSVPGAAPRFRSCCQESLHSKACANVMAAPTPWQDDSLRRMGVDRIDLVWINGLKALADKFASKK